MAEFIQVTVNGLTVGSFYALVALGYTMIYGIIRLINFAHGDIYMIGAFVGWTALSTVSGAHLPIVFALIIALVISMGVTGLLGIALEKVAYQPLLKAPPLSILITALGASLALENGAMLVYGSGFATYPQGLTQAGLQVMGVNITYVQMGMFLLSMLLMLGLYVFVQYTTVGTAMRALALDQDAARLMGVNVEGVISLTFFIGTALAAAAGVMMGEYYTQISFMMGFLLGLRAFTAAVLGGIGNIPGAVVGGLLIGLLESFSSTYISAQWTDVSVFAVLILVLIVKPTGIFGERVVERM